MRPIDIGTPGYIKLAVLKVNESTHGCYMYVLWGSYMYVHVSVAPGYLLYSWN